MTFRGRGASLLSYTPAGVTGSDDDDDDDDLAVMSVKNEKSLIIRKMSLFELSLLQKSLRLSFEDGSG